MSEPDFLSTSRIAIAGLGLMGGSLALALRDSCRSLLAYDPDQDTISLTRLHNKIVDHASTIPTEIFPLADVIISGCSPEGHPGFNPGITQASILVHQSCLTSAHLKWRSFMPWMVSLPGLIHLGGTRCAVKRSLVWKMLIPPFFKGRSLLFTALQRTSS